MKATDKIISSKKTTRRSFSEWLTDHRFVAVLTFIGLIVAIPAGVAQVSGFSLRDLLFSSAEPENPSDGIFTSKVTTTPAAEPVDGGWGPERAVYSVASGGAPFAAYNCIIDNPNWGDERNFMVIMDAGDKDGDWANRVEVQDGHDYKIRILVNNCGPDKDITAESSWIHDARAKLVLSTGSKFSHGASAFLSGANVTEVWSSVTMWNDKPFRITYSPGDAILYSNAHPIPGMRVSTDLLAKNGFKLGYEKMDGKMRPGYQYVDYIYVKVKVSLS